MKIPGEKIEVIVNTKHKLIGVKCDVCGRIIEPPSKANRYDWMNYKYYEVTTGHHDWGNDSCESIEQHDICTDCIGKFVTEYLGSKEANRSGYIEIQTEHVYYDETI
jgi:hypothetical protein